MNFTPKNLYNGNGWTIYKDLYLYIYERMLTLAVFS